MVVLGTKTVLINFSKTQRSYLCVGKVATYTVLSEPLSCWLTEAPRWMQCTSTHPCAGDWLVQCAALRRPQRSLETNRPITECSKYFPPNEHIAVILSTVPMNTCISICLWELHLPTNSNLCKPDVSSEHKIYFCWLITCCCSLVYTLIFCSASCCTYSVKF